MHEKTEISNLFVIGWIRILTPHDSSIAVQRVKLFVFVQSAFFFVAKTLYRQYIYVLFQNPRLLDNHTIKPHRRTKKWDPWILDPEEHFSKALN